jgi:hypothetical protein
MRNPFAFAAAALCALALALAGCATPTKMAFENDADRVTPAGKPIFLMTANIWNNYKTGYQPRLLVVHVERDGVKDSADRINFTMDEKAKVTGSGTLPVGNNYLLRMALDPGRYEIRGLTSMVQAFPVAASFFAPLHAPLESREPGVYYLGRVTAIVRERQGNEFKAGPSIPLIDQAVAGASGGTFDITISDEFAADEKMFRAAFAALRDVEIHKAILPPFDRAKAQKWWEDN